MSTLSVQPVIRDETNSYEDMPASRLPPRDATNLALLLVDSLRRLRISRLIIRRNREGRRADRELLSVALAMLRERDQQIDRMRQERHYLCEQERAARAEIQRYTAARLREGQPV